MIFSCFYDPVPADVQLVSLNSLGTKENKNREKREQISRNVQEAFRKSRVVNECVSACTSVLPRGEKNKANESGGIIKIRERKGVRMKIGAQGRACELCKKGVARLNHDFFVLTTSSMAELIDMPIDARQNRFCDRSRSP